jgi:hypothetical protein
MSDYTCDCGDCENPAVVRVTLRDSITGRDLYMFACTEHEAQVSENEGGLDMVVERVDENLSEPRVYGFWLHTEHGPAHVLGDANMSEKTLEAIGEMVKAAHKMMDKKEESNHD